MWTFLARLVTRTVSAVTLLTLLAGIPTGLVRYVGWPLPDHVPSLAEIQTFLTSGLSDQALINMLAVVLWPLWLLFSLSVVVEAAATVRGVQARRVPLLSPIQGLAAALVAGLTAGVVAAAAPAVPLAASLVDAPPNAAVAAITAPAAAPAMVPAAYTTAAEPSTTVEPTTTKMVYRIAPGDWLWHIADRFLGNPERYTEIADLNPNLERRDQRFPDHIEATWELALPADAHDRGPRPHASGTIISPNPADTAPVPPPAPADTTPPPDSSPSTTPPDSSGSPSAAPSADQSPSATPTPLLPPDPDGVFIPPSPSPSGSATSPSPSNAGTSTSSSPPATPPPSSTPSAPASPPTDQQTPAEAPGWIQVAGGFIGVGLATGLLYAVAMVWRRRRNAYKPSPITSPVLDDPDLTPPLASHTRIRQALRRQDPQHVPPPPPKVPTVREYTSADIKPPLPPVGPTGAELAAVPPAPVTVGLGMTGPGALDAARALLVATLTSGTPDDPDAQGGTVIPASTLATLLGVSAVDLGPMQRLTVAPSFADALVLIEEEIIRRSRILTEHDAADVTALRASSALAEPLPQLLLITDQPDEGWHARLATAIRLGKTVEIGAAIIGDWPHGTTLTVAADGTTNADDGQRVAVLDTAAATDMLTMLREAHGDTPPPAPAQPQTPQPDADSDHDTEPPADSDHDDVPDHDEKHATVEMNTQAADTGRPANTAVAVGVLGTPTILGADGTPVRGLRAKSLELLVYLAVHRNGAPLAEIMEAIWPDATLRRASERLSTCVANLRGVIRSAAEPNQDGNSGAAGSGKKRQQLEPVVNTGGHYHLDPAIVDVDWWRVLDAYAQVATTEDDEAKLRHLQAAIAATSGGLADGMDYEWIDLDREHARRHLVKIYAQAADLIAVRDPHQSSALCDTACQLDPLSDELARRAMRAAAVLGDAEAIRHRLATLRRELETAGIDLDPETEQFAADLLRDLTNR